MRKNREIHVAYYTVTFARWLYARRLPVKDSASISGTVAAISLLKYLMFIIVRSYI